MLCKAIGLCHHSFAVEQGLATSRIADMRVWLSVALAGSVAMLHAACEPQNRQAISTPEQVGEFQAPGLFSIGLPSKDCEWRSLKTDESGGIKAHFFTCLSADETVKIVLIVEERKAEDDKTRRAALAAYWNTLVQGLKDKGYRELKGKQPLLDSPIPDHVLFSLQGKTPDGEPAHIRGGAVFGKRVYSLQAIGNTADEADRLIAMAKTLKER